MTTEIKFENIVMDTENKNKFENILKRMISEANEEYNNDEKNDTVKDMIEAASKSPISKYSESIEYYKKKGDHESVEIFSKIVSGDLSTLPKIIADMIGYGVIMIQDSCTMPISYKQLILSDEYDGDVIVNFYLKDGQFRFRYTYIEWCDQSNPIVKLYDEIVNDENMRSVECISYGDKWFFPF